MIRFLPGLLLGVALWASCAPEPADAPRLETVVSVGLRVGDCIGPATTLDEVRGRFEADVYPLMTRQAAGCIACHGPTSGRALTLGSTALESFGRLSAAGMLGLGPGMMLDRVERDAMPPDGPAWSDPEKRGLRDFVCQVQRLPETAPADEIFPPALVAPWEGAPSNEYDNTFLSWDQLKGRIATQFQDDWVRGGVDQFAENILLFGGVDFERAFIPARGATPEFLVGLSMMADDVCGQAVTNATGPFVGIDVDAPVRDPVPEATQSFSADDYTSISDTGSVREEPFLVEDGDPRVLAVTTNGGGRVIVDLPIDGGYEVTVLARGTGNPELARLSLGLDTLAEPFDVPAVPVPIAFSATFTAESGSRAVIAAFINKNDGTVPSLRELRVGPLTVRGPLPGTTDTRVGAEAETRSRVEQLSDRVLLRRSTAEEIGALYELLIDLEVLEGDRRQAWVGLCELLVQHPDFLFTRAPSADATPADRARALVVKAALDLLDRPPSTQELARYDLGEVSRSELIDEWLASDTFRLAYFKKMQIAFETDGTVIGDEPARLLTYLMTDQRPVEEALLADYTVDSGFTRVSRPSEHGRTGVLTMPGYIRNKPGLPHYNYAARVLSGFLGFVFEVPPEVLEQREAATATSTVDPQSTCYSCHRVLTPLAHQRLRWDDEGNHRVLDDDGLPIDDSDRGMVADYPFPGSGLEAFAQGAVRKEGFIRRMVNLQFQTLFGRPMRHDTDERALYRSLWGIATEGPRTPRAILEGILRSDAFLNSPGTEGSVE